ncbi:hypothetical protein ACHAXR_010860, partial [Thalassiosira sp. AJA248-18]
KEDGDSNNEKIDLDDEIRRLEEELAADDDDSESESESDDDDDDENESDHDHIKEHNSKKRISFGPNSIHEFDDHRSSKRRHNKLQDSMNDDDSGGGIICLSNLAHDRIEPLPQSALPQNKRRKLKGVDTTSTTTDDDDGVNKKRKKKRKLPEEEQREEHTVSEGLKHAVQDLLQNYIPSSQLDKPPFYCRICQHQSTCQNEFNTHRSTDFHKAAVKEERKRTYCKLCRKQLTSVVQMEEHLKSRPHRDKMDFVKGKQRGLIGRTTGRGNGGGGGRGAGGGRGWQKKGDSSGRQWC